MSAILQIWSTDRFSNEFGIRFPLNPENPDDGRTILSGVQQLGDIMTITANFPGVFILVSS